MRSTANRVSLSASTLIGDEVHNSAGENLGTIKEIMLDVRNGRVAYAVLAFGGFLGMGSKLFAVPWNALQLDAENHAFILDVDKEDLKHAVGFDPDNWPDFADPQWELRVHEFYNVAPYWE